LKDQQASVAASALEHVFKKPTISREAVNCNAI